MDNDAQKKKREALNASALAALSSMGLDPGESSVEVVEFEMIFDNKKSDVDFYIVLHCRHGE